MELLASSMEFHGIPWNCEILILINFIIGEVYFTVCCMISCNYISDNPLVVEIFRYFNSRYIESCSTKFRLFTSLGLGVFLFLAHAGISMPCRYVCND